MKKGIKPKRTGACFKIRISKKGVCNLRLLNTKKIRAKPKMIKANQVREPDSSQEIRIKQKEKASANQRKLM